MRAPYLYDDADVLINLADIKDSELLRKAEADITNLAMTGIYNRQYEKFNTDTLKDIHRTIFGQIYDWAGEFRTIQMIKSEDILGGDTVRYAYPKEIKRQLAVSMKEIAKLKRNGQNDKDVVFRLVRIIAQIWQTHPFREGNTRSVIVFAVLLAKWLGFEVDHELFKGHSAYVRSALVWASQGMYAKYEYLERIFFDAILHVEITSDEKDVPAAGKYEKVGDYLVRDYKERPHEYQDHEKSQNRSKK
ncbi:Probable adenosine monophosphate-protein transferase fic [uncultured Eubacterium sp.]|nr:Probable adenosine monophosphate-protein transferase fic [uncultured Eubacterium sp.]